MDNNARKSGPVTVLLMGQTPPPWHGQAVATKLLFDHDWPEFEVERLRMEFSEEMQEVGRFQWRKLAHLWELIRKARRYLKANPGTVLFYPPASAKWVPFIRDVFFLGCVRRLAGSTVFIYHASGLPVFANQGALRKRLARMIYGGADISLEVAQEKIPPHEVFSAKSWQWCPCAIEVPAFARPERPDGRPFTALFVGSLQEGKGVLEIFKTAEILKNRGIADRFRFRIVGKWFSEEFEKEARELRNALGLEDSVELVGQLTGDAKWDAYREADVFFFPTHYASEATPIVLMEALGMGLPVVSTQWAGIPAMLDGCESAVTLPIRSPDAYADALLAMAERPGDAKTAATSSLAHYRAHFLPERFVDRVGNSWQRARNGVSGAIRIHTYLADQNPMLGRSLGISRMTEVTLAELAKRENTRITGVSSKSSLQMPGATEHIVFPWSTRLRPLRVLTDHLHPLFARNGRKPDMWYYPKGFLPRTYRLCRPSVVTIHDTIIQYYEDHYPKWRSAAEYRYWANMLRHTLRHADAIMTVSESSRKQIDSFMRRHHLPEKPIHVTYEPCMYESLPQPENPEKQNFVLHLGSKEPHKRTAWLVRQWLDRSTCDPDLPPLLIVGSVPDEVSGLAADTPQIQLLPFLKDAELREKFGSARALIFPSEIEGFGLPAIEAYYLGTPVCHTKHTSIEEVLSIATHRGGFSLDEPSDLFNALDDVLEMPASEIRDCGLKLRDAYAASLVADRITRVFEKVKLNPTD
ncbi:MAG: glycosyltransferase family 4 protein [Verrucomicrobiota bacterium JB025]